MVGNTRTYVTEESEVDPVTQTLTMRSRNASPFANLLMYIFIYKSGRCDVSKYILHILSLMYFLFPCPFLALIS